MIVHSKILSYTVVSSSDNIVIMVLFDKQLFEEFFDQKELF